METISTEAELDAVVARVRDGERPDITMVGEIVDKARTAFNNYERANDLSIGGLALAGTGLVVASILTMGAAALATAGAAALTAGTIGDTNRKAIRRNALGPQCYVLLEAGYRLRTNTLSRIVVTT